MQSEMNQYNDFIIGDYIDSYRNLTWKTFSGYQYVNEYCSHVEDKLILIQDDDILIDEAKLNSHVSMIEQEWGYKRILQLSCSRLRKNT